MLFWIALPIIILLVLAALTLWGIATLKEHRQSEPWDVDAGYRVTCSCGSFSFASKASADSWMSTHTCR